MTLSPTPHPTARPHPHPHPDPSPSPDRSPNPSQCVDDIREECASFGKLAAFVVPTEAQPHGHSAADFGACFVKCAPPSPPPPSPPPSPPPPSPPPSPPPPSPPPHPSRPRPKPRPKPPPMAHQVRGGRLGREGAAGSRRARLRRPRGLRQLPARRQHVRAHHACDHSQPLCHHTHHVAARDHVARGPREARRWSIEW